MNIVPSLYASSKSSRNAFVIRRGDGKSPAGPYIGESSMIQFTGSSMSPVGWPSRSTSCGSSIAWRLLS